MGVGVKSKRGRVLRATNPQVVGQTMRVDGIVQADKQVEERNGSRLTPWEHQARTHRGSWKAKSKRRIHGQSVAGVGALPVSVSTYLEMEKAAYCQHLLFA